MLYLFRWSGLEGQCPFRRFSGSIGAAGPAPLWTVTLNEYVADTLPVYFMMYKFVCNLKALLDRFAGRIWCKDCFNRIESMKMESKKPLLEVDLNHGFVPISRAASSLAALVKRSRTMRQPIIVTQKGYPAGVILDIELFTRLRELAEQQTLSVSGEDAEPEPKEVK